MLNMDSCYLYEIYNKVKNNLIEIYIKIVMKGKIIVFNEPCIMR